VPASLPPYTRSVHAAFAPTGGELVSNHLAPTRPKLSRGLGVRATNLTKYV